MKKILLAVLLVTMIVFGLVACTGSTTSDSSPAASTAAVSSTATESSAAALPTASTEASSVLANGKKTLNLVYLTPSTESQYWQQLGVGIQNAALDLQQKNDVTINLSVAGPATEAESDAYIKAFEDAIAKKPDGIITATLSPDATGPVAKEAFDQGIPICFGSMGIDQQKYGQYYLSHYFCDNTTIGESAAKAMLDALKAKGITAKGTIGVHMSVVVPVLEYRMSAFKAYMSKNAPDIKVVDTIYNENDVNKAQSNVENQLSTYKDLIGLYGANNISGDGIALAIKNGNLSNKICGVTVDADDLEVEALGNGNLDSVIVQTPYDQGYKCVNDVYNFITSGQKPAQQEVNVPPFSVTKANMNEEQYKDLLNPFLLKKTK
jgi:ABC-type sugar transport system, periplasmic component